MSFAKHQREWSNTLSEWLHVCDWRFYDRYTLPQLSGPYKFIKTATNKTFASKAKLICRRTHLHGHIKSSGLIFLCPWMCGSWPIYFTRSKCLSNHKNLKGIITVSGYKSIDCWELMTLVALIKIIFMTMLIHKSRFHSIVIF